MSPSYAELHCLSNFSFLRGASHPEELVERAVALGYSALALTDECSLAGAVRAHIAAEKHGLQLIIGAEVRLQPERQKRSASMPRKAAGRPGAKDGAVLTSASARAANRLVLLATDREGYGNLSQLISDGRRRSTKGQYRLAAADLDGGLPGCFALLLPPDDPDVARDQADWLRERFPQRCWIAAELLLDGNDDLRLAQLQALSQESGVPLVAPTWLPLLSVPSHVTRCSPAIAPSVGVIVVTTLPVASTISTLAEAIELGSW